MYGPYGVFEYIYEQLKIKRHLVIVVAEGAGSGVRDLQKLSKVAEKDSSGNVKLPVYKLVFRILESSLKLKLFSTSMVRE